MNWRDFCADFVTRRRRVLASLRKKNDFVGALKNLTLDADLKITLLEDK